MNRFDRFLFAATGHEMLNSKPIDGSLNLPHKHNEQMN